MDLQARHLHSTKAVGDLTSSRVPTTSQLKCLVASERAEASMCVQPDGAAPVLGTAERDTQLVAHMDAQDGQRARH